MLAGLLGLQDRQTRPYLTLRYDCRLWRSLQHQEVLRKRGLIGLSFSCRLISLAVACQKESI